MHPAEELWSHHHPPQGYPSGVIAVPEPIPGIAFFPGGYGLWREDLTQPLPEFPIGGIMVLGHDFHSKSGYDASLSRGREAANQPTWRNLANLLERAGVPFSQCFFTNVYMGLRDDGTTSGPFPGASDPVFVAHCVAFLREQLKAQQPSLVLTLGINVPSILATLSADLATWGQGRGLKHLDATNPVRYDVAFDGIDALRTTIVALIHPSLRAATVRHRRYGGEIGDAAELAMLRDALGNAPPSP